MLRASNLKASFSRGEGTEGRLATAMLLLSCRWPEESVLERMAGGVAKSPVTSSFSSSEEEIDESLQSEENESSEVVIPGEENVSFSMK